MKPFFHIPAVQLIATMSIMVVGHDAAARSKELS
jgi:hypothetical protein